MSVRVKSEVAFSITVTPTVQNAAYSAGNCMGGLIQIPSTPASKILLQNLVIVSKGGLTVPINAVFFDGNPSNTTFTDKAALSLNVADIGLVNAYVQASFSLPAIGTPTVATVMNIGALMDMSANAAGLYMALIASGTLTPASTSDLVVTVAGIEI